MIRLFDRSETNFNHNKNILSPLSCFVTEESNGMFELECEVDKSVSIESGQIIKAPTPRGEQLFRIYRPVKTLKTIKVYARHIFYDLSKNFIISYVPTNVSCDTAIKGVLSNAETSHGFTGSSDILDTNTASFTRISPVQAILGDKGIVNTWGGNLVRNGFTISIKAFGLDRGYQVRMGKNLIGVEDDSDESNIVTRLYPTVVLGDSDTVYALPEKYVDSDLLSSYGDPVIREEKVELTDAQKALTLEEIYTIMRNHCEELYDTYNIDKPIVNYKIDFVEVSKTEQYKDLAILEQLDLYDIVSVYISQLNINVKAKAIKYKYDCLKNRYESIELGSFKSIADYQTPGIVKQIQDRITVNESAIDHATNVITGNKGGYVIIRRYPNGKPYEILIMDTEDINTATNVLRINNSGIGFSQSGYNGPYGTAMTIDGHIVADFVDTGTLTAILLQSSNYAEDESHNPTAGMKINMADGTILSELLQITTTGGLIKSGNYVEDTVGIKIDLGNGVFDTKYFKLSTEGKVTMTGGEINIETAAEDQSVISFNFSTRTMTLTPLFINFANGTTGLTSSLQASSVSFYDSTILKSQLSSLGLITPSISCTSINSGTPITSANFGSTFAGLGGQTASIPIGDVTLNFTNGILTSHS